MIESRECAARDRSAVATLTIEAHHGPHLPSRPPPASRTARPRFWRAKQRLYDPRAPAHRGGRAPSVPHQEQGREFRAGCGRGLAEPPQLGRPPSGAVVLSWPTPYTKAKRAVCTAGPIRARACASSARSISEKSRSSPFRRALVDGYARL